MAIIDLADDTIKNARALVYKDENGVRYFLLTQELDGAYTLPGGCKDLEDPDIASALLRELKEELGLDIDLNSFEDARVTREYQNLYMDQSSERFGKVTKISLFLIRYTDEYSLSPGNDIGGVAWFNGVDARDMLTGLHMKELFADGLLILNEREIVGF